MVRPAPRVVAIGDAIVDFITPPMAFFPAGDFQAEVQRFDALPGGNATNFALAIATLGAATTFVGAVGVDANARLLRAAYRRHGVRAILQRDGRRPTGATMALTWTGGGRTLVTALGANAFLRPEHVPDRILRSAHHVHRAGFWWATNLIGRPSASILARARRFGASTSLDVSTDPRGWSPDRVRAVRACLPYLDMFFGNETEVCAIAGIRRPLQAARRLRALGALEVVVHQGDRGATAVTQSNRIRSQPFGVSIDNPTGCGDVFNAAYVYSRLTEGSIPESLRLANAAAAVHLRDRRHLYPTLTEVRRLLREFGRP